MFRERWLPAAMVLASLSLPPYPARLLAQGSFPGDSVQLSPSADAAPPAPAADPTVSLLTFGPGSRVYEVWGHNAIWIRDPARGIDVTYNWGLFSFDQENFILRFIRGTMLYWMGGAEAEPFISWYMQDNRDIWAQELNLTRAQKLALVDYLVRTDTPENRYYRYDYYRDNCSTRVRDALDMVLGGRIADALTDEPAGVTWRWHARRILRSIPAAYAGIELGLGNPADAPISRWEESFLPLELMRHIRDVTVTDASGREVPLVARETRIFRSTRTPEPEEPPFWIPWFLLAGVALGGVIVGAAARRGAAAPAPGAAPEGPERGRLAVLLAGGGAALWSFAAGLAGLLLSMAWLFTDHTFWYRNENLLQASPLSLALALLLVAGHLRGGAPTPWLSRVALGVFGLSVSGFALQALPGFDQVNGEIIALALPVHAAVAWLAVQLGRATVRPE